METVSHFFRIGMLSRDELIDGYTKILNSRDLAVVEVDKIIDIVDINKSG
jgi:calcium-dependent protein kinase